MPNDDWRHEYMNLKELPALGGKLAGVHRMVYTAGLFVGLTDTGVEYRYCYPNVRTALQALDAWDGAGDPPGPWIKRKGHPDGERLGPGALKEEDDAV